MAMLPLILMMRLAGDPIDVPLVSAQWTLYQNHSAGGDTATRPASFESHLGRPSLIIPDGLAIAKGVSFQNGTLEADVATIPNGAFFGLAFHVESFDKYELVFFRPHASEGTVQYSPSFFNMNAWQLYPPPEYVSTLDFPQDRWVHLRIVIKGLVASVYLDTATTPTVEVHDLALGSTGGTIGFWGRGGGGYLSNVRYRPDPTTYPLVRVHPFAPGAITEGWSISDAYPLASTDPDVYPKVGSLRWQPVGAEREGMVDIGRYRKDPRVESPRPSADGPVPPSPGMQVVFARTQITSDRARTAKVWVGYSDDIVVFLNGQPLYEGHNGMSYRSESSLGWFYPYADAVFLPLQRGPNDLVLAVSESSAGWAFMCRFDRP